MDPIRSDQLTYVELMSAIALHDVNIMQCYFVYTQGFLVGGLGANSTGTYPSGTELEWCPVLERPESWDALGCSRTGRKTERIEKHVGNTTVRFFAG